MSRTHDYTGWFEAQFDSVIAEVAFVCSICLGVNVNGVIGTRIHASLTTDAVVVIKVHHAVGGPKQRRRWTDLHTGSVVALVAAHDGKVSSGFGEFTHFDVFDPSAIHAEGHVVFAFTRDSARVAPDTGLAIEKKSEASHCPL
ncbi:MAG: hypothetical protein QF637_03880 [Acidimicrobiales bacterium]|nr:hypothetical protein [Acidimicrobiales bacterium]